MASGTVARLLGAAVLCALAAAPALSDEQGALAGVTLLFDRPLPNAPGKSVRGVLVAYGPGGSTPAHTHPASAFIVATVLEGVIRSKVNDGPERVYRAGESWTEMPRDRHAVSANASDTEGARLLAVFVLDSGETELVTLDAK